MFLASALPWWYYFLGWKSITENKGEYNLSCDKDLEVPCHWVLPWNLWKKAFQQLTLTAKSHIFLAEKGQTQTHKNKAETNGNQVLSGFSHKMIIKETENVKKAFFLLQ